MTKSNVQVKLTGKDGNAFAIIGNVSRALKTAGHRDLADEMVTRCMNAESYDQLLQIVMEYVIVN